MILAAHQAQYMPYPGLLAKVDAADIFIVQDDLQFTKQEWQNRNRIRTHQGWMWLTVPVHAKSKSKICEVMPAEKRWVYRHRRTVDTWYGRSKYLDRLNHFWGVARSLRDSSLAELNYRTTLELLLSFNIRTEIVLQSEIGLTEEECRTPDHRLIALCKRLGCSTYLSGVGAQVYMNLETWRESGIALKFQAWHQKEYKQMFPGWVANMSSIDLLLCNDTPLNLLRSDRAIFDYNF
jgi:hypothetical protein